MFTLQAVISPFTDKWKLFPNHTSSFLRAGSKFVGTQQSDRQVYNVDVEIKHVDMAESYLCGYLRIQGSFSIVRQLAFGGVDAELDSPSRPDGRPSDIDNLLRGRDNRDKAHLPDTP